MKLETFRQLTDLLPNLVDLVPRVPALRDDPGLAAMEVQRRLAVLVRIETVLAADGLAWDDLAMQMMPPALPPGDLMTMTATALRCDGLTEHAGEFLADLRGLARQAQGDPVYLTERQSEWLWNLYRRTLDQRARAQQQVSEQDGASNVVYLAKRVTA